MSTRFAHLRNVYRSLAIQPKRSVSAMSSKEKAYPLLYVAHSNPAQIHRVSAQSIRPFHSNSSKRV